MNKDAYMEALAVQLRKLPREDYVRAMEYFEEYFDEAGPENEQQAIGDLGSPETAARQILMEIAVKNSEQTQKSVKRGLNGVWIGILGVFAAPIGLPLALAAVIVVMALVFVALALVLCVVLVSVMLAVTSVVGFIGSVCLLFISPVNGLTTLGMALFCIGLCILAILGSVKLLKWFLGAVSHLFARMVKGGRRNEKK